MSKIIKSIFTGITLRVLPFFVTLLASQFLAKDDFELYSVFTLTTVIVTAPFVGAFGNYTSANPNDISKHLYIVIAILSGLFATIMAIDYQVSTFTSVSLSLIVVLGLMLRLHSISSLNDQAYFSISILTILLVAFFSLMIFKLDYKGYIGFLFLYSIMSILIIIKFMLSRPNVIFNGNVNWRIFIKFLIVAFLGTPILALVLKINNPTSDLEWITIFNASYHWLTLTTVLPGILGSVLMRRAKDNNIIRRYYLAILALPAIFISLVIYLISNVIPVLYPTLEPDVLSRTVVVFSFAGVFLILYQGLQQLMMLQKNENRAISIVMLFSVVALVSAFFLGSTTVANVGLILGCSYCISFVTFFSFNKFKIYES
ncbi:TPA: hypothetical protein MM253_004634 [Escherichia coli]|nr:hypothetical protein [Escherichia coli]HBZ8252838.1 hypothetical protein [Escherichia coli]